MGKQGVLRPGKTVPKFIQERDTRTARRVAPLESAVVASILKYLNSLPDCRAIKTAGDAKRLGEPDIDCCYKGRAIKLEVKRPGREHGYSNDTGKLTKLQIATLSKWKAAGAIAGVVCSVEDVKRILERKGLLEGKV